MPPRVGGLEGEGRPRAAIWVSTSRATRGGVATYVRNAEVTDFWRRWNVRHIATHADGSRWTKLAIFAGGAIRFAVALLSRPDIVHFHASARGSFFRKAVLIRLCRAAGVPIVTHIHDGTFDEFYGGLNPVLRALVRRTLSDSDVVIALGPRWRDRLQSIIPDADVRSLPNGVSSRSAQPVAQPETGVHVVFVGQIGALKGTFDLLGVWGRVDWSARAPGARLTIAGDGAVDRARALRDTLPNAASVEILDWLSPDDVARLLDSAHVLVLPSTHEGQPMAILEAMARGLCIVASDVGGIPDLVTNGSTAVLVPAGDPDLLKDALIEVVHDAGLRRDLGAAAWRASAQFDLNAIAGRIEDVYSIVLESRARKRVRTRAERGRHTVR